MRLIPNYSIRIAVESAVVLLGMTLAACAFGAGRAWLDRHFLPSFFVRRSVFVQAAWIVRFLIAILGIALVFVVRPFMGRLVYEQAGALVGDAARILFAVALALATAEVVIRCTFWRARESQLANEEPLRGPDSRLGWSFVPSRTGRETIDGRAIEYIFDSSGYRVRRSGEAVDPARPTILFTGESIMAGHGLNWAETIPAQVESLTGIQSANLAVHGFANDQAYLRLATEMPRFEHPVAVVSLFMPSLFDRNLDVDRPHLGPGLVWIPAEHPLLLLTLAKYLAPYRSAVTIDRGIALTREVLRATVDLALAHQATPLIVVPQFVPEDPVERDLRRKVLDDSALPYLYIELDPSWHIPRDSHPDARADRAIAAAIGARLQVR